MRPAILLVLLALASLPALATQSLVQHFKASTILNCGPVCPAQSVTLQAGDLVVLTTLATGGSSGTGNIASVVCTPSCGTWAHPPAPASAQSWEPDSGGTDTMYVLSSVAGATSIVVTMNVNSPGVDLYLREYRTTSATGWRFDNVATSTPSSSLTTVTPGLALTGNGDVVITGGAVGRNSTGMAAPWTDVDIGPNGSIEGDQIGATNVVGATVTQNAAGDAAYFTIGFADNVAPPVHIISLACTPSPSSTPANPGVVVIARAVVTNGIVGPYTVLTSNAPANCAYQDKTVQAGVTYSYKVDETLTANGVTCTSEIVTANCKAIVPTPVYSNVTQVTVPAGPSTLVTPVLAITVSPSSTASSSTITVTVNVGGSPVPTGRLAVTGSGYVSPVVTLVNGSAVFSIPGNTMNLGADTLTVAYTPDAASAAVYNSVTGTAFLSLVPGAPTGLITNVQ